MNTLIETNKKPRRSIVMQLLAFVMLLLGSHSAMAVCSGGGGTFTVSLPSTVVVPRDIAVGQPLTPWISSGTAYYSCPYPNIYTSYYGRGIAAKNPSLAYAGVSYSDSTYPASTGSYTLYKTGVDGVGMAVMFAAVASNGGWGCGSNPWNADLGQQGTYSPPGGWNGLNCYTKVGSAVPNVMGSEQGTIRVRLVRIAGSVTNGGQTYAGSLSQICATAGGPFSGTSGTLYLDSAPCTQANITPATIMVAACTTPDVKVDLGSHNVSDADLAAIGSTTTAVPVNIKLNNCPAGMNAIQYRIEPNTTVVNQALSIVSLDSAASASGVGVQLLNSTGTAPFALSTTTFQAFAPYNKSTGGDYVIPLMARYYRTGNLSPGTATSSLVFTMLYL